MFSQYYQESKYQPSYVAEPRVAAGLHGRKTGRGWYAYGKDGSAEKIAEPAVPKAKPSSVWVAPNARNLKDLAAKLGARLEDGDAPSPGALCMVAPLGQDATSSALDLRIDPARTVAVDPLFGFSKRRTLMTTPVTTPDMRDAAHALLAADGTPVSVIRDSAGFVAQRVVAHIVNVGCDIAQQGIATPEDLDRAVVLGLGYPNGPLGLGDALGPAKVLTVLDAMHAFYREPRYRPSPWLQRRARLGVSLLTPES
jgi:3-hydroxybutyryl-CoA dehydrogenase